MFVPETQKKVVPQIVMEDTCAVTVSPTAGFAGENVIGTVEVWANPHVTELENKTINSNNPRIRFTLTPFSRGPYPSTRAFYNSR
jgi:hypothetical protein